MFTQNFKKYMFQTCRCLEQFCLNCGDITDFLPFNVIFSLFYEEQQSHGTKYVDKCGYAWVIFFWPQSQAPQSACRAWIWKQSKKSNACSYWVKMLRNDPNKILQYVNNFLHSYSFVLFPSTSSRTQSTFSFVLLVDGRPKHLILSTEVSQLFNWENQYKIFINPIICSVQATLNISKFF